MFLLQESRRNVTIAYITTGRLRADPVVIPGDATMLITRWLKYLIPALLIGGLSTPPVWSDEVRLAGTVSHSTVRGSVAEYLQPGKVFDTNSVMSVLKVQHKTDWHRVPNWLFGKWHDYDGQIFERETFRDGQQTVLAVQESIDSPGMNSYHGTLLDTRGDAWELDPAPYMRHTVVNGSRVIQVVTDYRVVSMEERKVTYCIDGIQVTLDAFGQIKSTKQQEDYQTFTLNDYNQVKLVGSARIFDQFGKPLRGYQARADLRKIGSAKPLTTPTWGNFKSFLERESKLDLLPAEPLPPATKESASAPTR